MTKCRGQCKCIFTPKWELLIPVNYTFGFHLKFLIYTSAQRESLCRSHGTRTLERLTITKRRPINIFLNENPIRVPQCSLVCRYDNDEGSPWQPMHSQQWNPRSGPLKYDRLQRKGDTLWGSAITPVVKGNKPECCPTSLGCSANREFPAQHKSYFSRGFIAAFTIIRMKLLGMWGIIDLWLIWWWETQGQCLLWEGVAWATTPGAQWRAFTHARRVACDIGALGGRTACQSTGDAGLTPSKQLSRKTMASPTERPNNDMTIVAELRRWS